MPSKDNSPAAAELRRKASLEFRKNFVDDEAELERRRVEKEEWQRKQAEKRERSRIKYGERKLKMREETPNDDAEVRVKKINGTQTANCASPAKSKSQSNTYSLNSATALKGIQNFSNNKSAFSAGIGKVTSVKGKQMTITRLPNAYVKVVKENIDNKTSFLQQPKIISSNLVIPSVAGQNVKVQGVLSGNKIRLIKASSTSSLNLKNIPTVIKDLQNILPNLKPNSTVFLVKKQLNPALTNSTAGESPSASNSGTSSCGKKTTGTLWGNANLSAAAQLDHAYAHSSKDVEPLEESLVSPVEYLSDDLMDLGYSALLNGLMDVDKTREIEEQVIFETLPVEQSPPNVISVRGEKEQKLEVMSDSVTLKRGRGRPRGSKKKNSEPTTDSLMNELTPVRRTNNGMVLRDTSVVMTGKKPSEERSLSQQSIIIHTSNTRVLDHDYSLVNSEFKGSAVESDTFRNTSNESRKRKIDASNELDEIQILSDPPVKRKPPMPNEGKDDGNESELDYSHMEKQTGQLGSSVQFQASTFFTDDEKVEFYTGVDTIENLWLLFRFLEDRIDTTSDSNRLPLFEQFCLTLMRLRLNLQPKDMAYRFGLVLPEVVDYITKFLSIMFTFLVPTYIHWSGREDTDSTLPNCFKLSGLDDCVCFVEHLQVSLSTDLASDDDASKNLTYLIGFTPAGLVSFVSIGFPSNWKKEQIWLKSGILNHLEHGDWILTERGKSVYKAEALHKAVNPFVENFGLQLVQVDEEEEETFSKGIVVQSHCKRVIESLKKKFAIFQSEITDFSSFSTVDQIIKVCCALHNNNG